MAEYYPLLARAVAGMRNAPAEQRRAIYDRARQALLGQLVNMQPPVPRESIDRESAALDEAIARVEADVIGTGASVPVEAVETPSRAAAPPTPPPLRKPILPPPRPGPARPGADALTRLVAERVPSVSTVRPAAETDPLEGSARQSPLPSAPQLQVPSFSDALDAAAADAVPGDERVRESVDSEPAGSAREETARPPAPRPLVRERFNPRALILVVVGVLVVTGIAYAAWRLRDRPEALAKSRAAMLAAQQAEQQNAKVSTRVDEPASATPPTVSAAAPAASAPNASSVQPAAVAPPETQPSSAVVPTPAPTASAPSADVQPSQAAAEPASPVQPAASGTAADAPAIAVTQRAAFLVDAPDDPQKIKTYVGTVVWSTDNASPVQNQPIARTVHADVDIPDAALKMSMVFQRNEEPQFPASHTLELRFTLEPTNTLGLIKQINVPQMRKDDSPAGEALIGLPVTITDNYFLVGLSRGDAVQHNLDLIKTRNWFDVPILLASGKVAKITFEKGTPGRQAIDDVLLSWQ